MTTTIPALSAFPPTPLRSDGEALFVSRTEARLEHDETVFQPEMSAIRTAINTLAGELMAAEGAASDSADAAALSAAAADASADAAALSATTALNAPGTNATSTTSLTVGTGSQAFTIQAGKAYVVGQFVTVASTASPVNSMSGAITAYNSGTGAVTVNVTAKSGSGTFADWTVGMTGQPASSAGIAQVTTATGNTTLTSTPTLLKITPAADGVVVTLPNATTCALGGPLFVVCNASSSHGVNLKLSVSGYQFTIPALASAEVYLVDNSSADGVWNVTAVATSTAGIPADALIVAGGGGGASGGGGAGGVRQISGIALVLGQVYTVTVGAGGASASSGNNSSMCGYTATGGGRGSNDTASNAAAGGSGGGGGASTAASAGATGNAGAYTPVEGYAGGSNATYTASPYPAGGGGGAGGVGGPASGAAVAGVGGVGITSTISGSSVGYGGGGGGGVYGAGGTGGTATHGGGGGRVATAGAGTAGTDGTGGGGGGGTSGQSGGKGGDGAGILRYPDTFPAITSTTGSPTVTVTGGYRIYKWTSSGSFTV